MYFKKIIQFIHLWLGLITGSLVFVIAITGALYCFQSDILQYTQPFRRASNDHNVVLSPSVIESKAKSYNPNRHLHSLLYSREEKSIQAIFCSFESYHEIVFIDPETGDYLGKHDVQHSFFGWILNGHFQLWLPAEIGRPVVSIATAIYFILIISGLLISLPKSRRHLSKIFRWDIQGNGKRINYQLHRTLGIYTMLFSTLFVWSGLIWGFEFVRDWSYALLHPKQRYIEYYEPMTEHCLPIKSTNLDRVFNLMNQVYPSWEWIEIHPQETPESPIAVNINPDQDTYWNIDYRYFSPESLQELKVEHPWGRNQNLSIGEKLLRMNYDIHVGSIGGLAGKTLAFGISIVIASMPITGFLIWKNRKKKNKR